MNIKEPFAQRIIHFFEETYIFYYGFRLLVWKYSFFRD